MRQLLTLSWLVREQVGAERGKLTLLGGLRSTKLMPKEALETAKKAPRGPKSGTGGIDGTPTGVIFGPGAPPKVT